MRRAIKIPSLSPSPKLYSKFLENSVKDLIVKNEVALFIKLNTYFSMILFGEKGLSFEEKVPIW